MKFNYKKNIAFVLSFLMSVNAFDFHIVKDKTVNAEGAEEKSEQQQNDNSAKYDVNGDGKVTIDDLASVLDCIGGSASDIPASKNPKFNAYEDDIIDIKDAVTVKNAVEKKTVLSESTAISDTADVYIESVTCGGGDTVTVNIGITDWAQDIEAVGLDFDFDAGLSVQSIKPLGNIRFAAEDNKIKFYGFMDKKAAYRGRIASVTFFVPEVETLKEYQLNVSKSDIYSSKLEKYTTKSSSGKIIADSSLRPTELRATEINSASAVLEWNMKSNTDKVKGYIVFRNGEEISRTVEKSYKDSGLSDGESYIYTVQAYGEDGYLSPLSKEYCITASVPEIKNISFVKTLGSVGGNTASVSFSLDRTVHASEVNAYSVDASGKKLLIGSFGENTLSSGNFDWDLTSSMSGTYNVEIEITDIDGTVISAVSDPVTVDRTAPEKTEGLNSFESDECVILTWGVSSQLNTVGYNIYRKTDKTEFEKIAYAEGRDTLGFTDNTTENNVVYYYTVTAVDCFGQESEKAEAVMSSSHNDITPPDVVLFMPESGSVISGTAYINAAASDNVGVSSLKCFISEDDGETWKEYCSTEGSSARWTFDTTSYDEADIRMKVMAYDSAGNESSGTNIHSYHIDNKAPETVTGLNLVEVYDTYATIAWEDVADKDFSYFIVNCTDDETGQTRTEKVSNKLGITLGGLSVGKSYTVTVQAADKTGNINSESESLVFKTTEDLHIPEITSINPAPGSYKGILPLCITARDNSSVDKILIEISTDKETYQPLTEVVNETGSEQFTAAYDLDLSAYEDGKIYIRGTASDAEGNVSVENSFVVEYLIDTAAPVKMTDVSVNTNENNLEIRWSNYEDDVVAYFSIYRKNEDTGEYSVIADNVKSLNYFDRNIEPGKEYFYKISATDTAGNESELSDEVSGLIDADITAPVIEKIYPDQELPLSKSNNFIRVYASDNLGLSSIKAEYFCGDEEGEYILLSEEKFTDNYGCLQAVIPEEDLSDGNKIHIRVSAEDKYGNISEYTYAEYIVDDTRTSITSCYLSQEDGTGKLTLKWTSDEKDSTLGYYIYRRFNDGEYKIVGSVKAENGEYEFIEEDIVDAGMCTYKVVAMNNNSNQTYMESNTVEVYQTPQAVLGCESKLERGVEYMFDASASTDHYGIAKLTIDYGDGCTETAVSAADAKFIHQYAVCGSYEVKLVCTNAVGLSSSVTKLVEVTERALIGEVTVKVKTTNGKAAKNIDVYCDVGTEYQSKMRTDENGQLTFRTTAGQHDIGVYSDGYLPEIKSCTIMAGSNNPVEFSVVEQDIVTAEFDVQRMTLEEIKAVGIDVTAYDNQHFLAVDLHLSYSLSQDYSTGGGTLYACGGNGCGIISWVPWNPVNVPSGDTPQRKVEPVAVIMDEKQENVEAVILLDVPVEASYLKEFFDVKLHIINNASSEFSLNSNIVTLDVPDGLTLMSSLECCDNLVTYINEIKGQSQKTLEWILRGDKKGEYKLVADYQGILSEFNEKVQTKFESDTISVTANESLKFDIYVPETINENETYIKVSATNVSGHDVYNVANVIENAVSNTFGVINDKISVSLYSSYINDIPYYAEILENGKPGVETLSDGETYSAVYRLGNIFIDGENPETDEIVNFHDETLYLNGFDMTGSEEDKKMFKLYTVEEIDIHTKYDHSNDKENMEKLNGSNAKEYAVIKDGSNLAVDKIANELRYSEYLTGMYESEDDILNFLLSPGFDDIKDRDKRDYIDSVIMDMLVSDDIQARIMENYTNAVTEAYRDVIYKAISGTKDFTEAVGDKKDQYDTVKEFITCDKTKVIDAMEEFRRGGSAGMSSYISRQISSNLSSFDLSAEFTNNLTDSLRINVANVFGVVSDMNEAFNTELEDYYNMQMMRAVQEETEVFLKTLMKQPHIDELSLIVSEQATNIYVQIQGNSLTDKIVGGARIVNATGESIASSVIEDTMGAFVTGATGPIGAFVYMAAGMVYETQEENIDNKYLLPAKIVILDNMYDAVSRDIDSYIDKGDYETAMRYLEYLTRLRIKECSACKTFSYSIKNGKINIEYFNTPQLRLLYQFILRNCNPNEMSKDIDMIQRARDKIFLPSISSRKDISVEAITYNYRLNETSASLDSRYEYSVNDGEWITCSGPVSVEITAKEPILKIRKKATSSSVAGEIKNIRLKRREYLEGDLKVKYVDGYYIFDSVCKGDNLQVIFSDSEEVSERDWLKAYNCTGEPISAGEHRYVHVRTAATVDTPASQVKSAIVVSSVNVLIGKNDGGSVTGEGKYDIGSSVTVTAKAESGYKFAGWIIDGDIVSTESSYKFTANEDTTIFARFLPDSEYKITLSSNVEQAAVKGVCVDGKGKIYVISTECDDDTLEFSHWADAAGNIISYMRTYPFVIEGETNLKAVYVKKSN